MASLSAFVPVVSGYDYVAKFNAMLAYVEPYLTNVETFTFGSGVVGIGGTPGGTARLETVTSSTGVGVIARNTTNTSYSSMRLYNDQNSNLRSLEIDYSGSSYATAVLTGGPTGEAGAIATTGAYPLVLGTNNTARAQFGSTGDFKPCTNNAYALGISGAQWTFVWVQSGVVSTSDRRSKTEIADSALGLAFICALRPVSYKFIVGKNVVSQDDDGEAVVTPVPGVRRHWGLIAQEVKAAVDAAGVDDFGGWISDDVADPQALQGLRYEQFIAPLIKAVKEQQALIVALATRVAALEAG